MILWSSFKEEHFLRTFSSLRFSFLALIVFALSLVFLPATSFAATHSSVSHQPRAESPGPQRPICGGSSGWVFDTGVNHGRHQRQFGPTYSNYNGLSSTASMTLTETVGGTMTITASASVEIDANAVLAGAKATVSASLSVSLTASSSNSITFNVPAHEFGNGNYGVWYYSIYGHYYYYSSVTCSITEDDGYITFNVPNAVGWNIWSSTN